MEFDAVVRSAQSGGALIQLPAEAAELFGTRARFPVRAWLNEAEYLGSTMPTGEGRFCLGLTKAIRTLAGVDIGQSVHVVIELDTEQRTIEVPDDLARALEHANLTKSFAALAPTHRREYSQWVTDAKKPEARARRVAKVVEMLTAKAPRTPV
jgi:hypothetical protein